MIKSSYSRGLLLMVAAIIGGTEFLGGCSFFTPRTEEAVIEEPEPVISEPVEEPPQHSDAEYVELEAAYGELEERATRTQLTLLERDAQITELQLRLESQRRMIDETISEVVRAKSKLRSVESRAEAASQMAEAEIALKALGEMSGATRTDDYRAAADLMERSADEFEGENYGGAIYVTSQAKTIISLAQIRLRNREPIEVAAGEIAFNLPVPLWAERRSNVREGPGLDFSVVTTLEAGDGLTGYSYKGKWLHVKLEDGTDGWIYLNLVDQR